MAIELERGQRDLLLTLGSLGIGLVAVWLISGPPLKMSLSRLIDAKVTADLASRLPPNEREFVWEAWNLVGCGIKYKPYGSDFQFINDSIKGYRIDLPSEVLALGESNCVGKSALLTSILRNRLPANRVYMVIGNLAMDGLGGHAWVMAEVEGQWYRLEATHCPKSWADAQRMSGFYQAKAMFNDQQLICYDPGLCLSISPSSCCDALCQYGY